MMYKPQSMFLLWWKAYDRKESQENEREFWRACLTRCVCCDGQQLYVAALFHADVQPWPSTQTGATSVQTSLPITARRNDWPGAHQVDPEKLHAFYFSTNDIRWKAEYCQEFMMHIPTVSTKKQTKSLGYSK